MTLFAIFELWFSASTFVVKIAAFAKPQNGERQIMILACANCTGHGVPGAFMSMIGNEILTNIVEIQGITSPDLILNELHKNIRTALKQGETENRDGMDISWGRPRELGQRRLGQQ